MIKRTVLFLLFAGGGVIVLFCFLEKLTLTFSSSRITERLTTTTTTTIYLSIYLSIISDDDVQVFFDAVFFDFYDRYCQSSKTMIMNLSGGGVWCPYF